MAVQWPLFGGRKKPVATAAELAETTEKNVAALEAKIELNDKHIDAIKQSMAKMPNQNSATFKTSLEKWKTLETTKKTLMVQLKQLTGQSNTISQIAFATQNAQTTIAAAEVMKQSVKELKEVTKAIKKVDIYDIQEDAKEALDDIAEANTMLTDRSYGGVTEDIDDDDLLAQLNDVSEPTSADDYLPSVPRTEPVPAPEPARTPSSRVKLEEA
jgi:DNA repair exonuclease SbcCD ATPase subunit